jgi:hypothetical protein
MNNPHRFILEPYKGPSTRYTCPQCRKPREFTRYVDTVTGELLPEYVGKCNRADSCGYHEPPREFFREHGVIPYTEGTLNLAADREEPSRPLYLHSRKEVAQLRGNSEQNTLSAYWRCRIGAERWDEVARKYALGTWTDGTLASAAVFWQVDLHGNIRAGKMMLYDPATGKRRKDVRSTSFAHYERTGRNAGDLNVQQCLFGEHLLKEWPIEATVAVVESEKTALIASALMPEILWLATGSLGGFTLEKLHVLAGRKVLAYPDLSPEGKAFAHWKQKALEIAPLFAVLHVSDLLERHASEAARSAGADIADLLFQSKRIEDDQQSQTQAPKSDIPAVIRSEAEVVLARWAEKNPAILNLLNILELDLSAARIVKQPPL